MIEFMIPDEGITALRALMQLGEDGIDSLRMALESTGPTLANSSERAVLVEESMGLENQGDDLVRILSHGIEPLFALIANIDVNPSSFFAIFTHSLNQNEEWEEEDEKLWQKLRDPFLRLFGSEVIRTEGKASILFRQRPSRVLATRLITDSRPIFNDNRDKIMASLVMNTLRIRYVDGDNSNVIHFSLDEDDLEQLEKQLRESRVKNDLVTRQQNDSGVPVLKTPTSNPFGTETEGEQ